MSIGIETSVTAPYPGLRPFRPDESLIFFGRDQQIDEVLVRLKSHQFLGIVGTSGCGKSSLVRAGMLPALESGLMGKVGSTWYVADMKPGDAPLTNLAKALIKSDVFGDRWAGTPEGIALLTAALRKSDISLVNLIRQVELPKFTNLLVVVDQFEEIFRFQQQDPNEALTFVNLLLNTISDRSVPIYVVLTMRSDFLGQCSTFLGLPEALNDAQYLCPRLTRDQLSEAIEGPANVFEAEVEPGLVTQIINDAGANSDQLPLVQHVLARMWNRLAGDQSPHIQRILRLEDYRLIGGLKGVEAQSATSTKKIFRGGRSLIENPHFESNASRRFTPNALSQHADEAYFDLHDESSASKDLGPDHKPSRKQIIAQMLFRCLAARGASGQYVRHPVKVADVASVAGCKVDEVTNVVEVFRREDRSFLVPSVAEKKELTAADVLDISHEALIRQWQRFGGQSEQTGEHESVQSWLEIEEQSRRHYRRLAEAAENEKEKTAGLLRNPELGFLHQWWRGFSPTRAWANACVPSSYDRSESLLKRSLAQAEDEEREKQADQQARIAAAEEFARKMKRRSIEIAVVAVMAVVGLIAAILASQKAFRQEAIANEMRVKADEQAKVAQEEATKAKTERKNAEDASNRAAEEAVRASEAKAEAERQLRRSEGLVYANTLASAQREWDGGNSGLAWDYLNAAQWNLRGWEHDYLYTKFNAFRHSGPVVDVAFSPDGKRIVSGSMDGTLKVWDATSGQKTLTLHGHIGWVSSVAFSPDGKRIVSGALDGTLKVWDATSGQETLTLKGHTAVVDAVAFSPDGKRIVSGSGDMLRVWDAPSGQKTAPGVENSR
jgi:ABC-type dipeptide/oligopeptide/nickel transport system ATPase component